MRVYGRLAGLGRRYVAFWRKISRSKRLLVDDEYPPRYFHEFERHWRHAGLRCGGSSDALTALARIATAGLLVYNKGNRGAKVAIALTSPVVAVVLSRCFGRVEL